MSSDLRSFFQTTRAGTTAPAAGRARARRLLEACWTPLWRAFSARLPELLVESLAPMAKEDDPDLAKPAKQVLVRDRRFVAEYELALKTEFGRAVEDFVRGKPVEPGVEKKSGKDGGSGLGAGLSLIEYGDMELNTLVEASASRVRNATDDMYGSLRMRLANAVHEAEIRPGESPFRPAIFFRALHAALAKLDVLTADQLMLVMPRFDGPIVKLIADTYSALDTHLSSQGHANELSRNTIARSTVVGRSTRSSGLSHSTGMPGGGGGIGGAHAEQILQALYSRLQLVPAGGPVAPGVVLGGVTRPRMGDLSALSHGLPQLAGTGLTIGGQVGLPLSLPLSTGMPLPPGTAISAPAGTVALPGAPLVIGAELLAAINEIQKLGALAMAAAQQGHAAPDAAVESAELRSRLMEKTTAQVDKLTIEIVGLLFDRITADRHVPQPVKELLQRLQFPLIKVAVTDPALFVSPDHPARKLIDRIASTSIGWISDGEANERYLAEVQKAVHTVLAATEEGITAFERALEAFESYLEEERTRDDDPVLRAKRALAEAEEREVMAINATIKIRSAFDGVQIESYLREFLLETWVRVLVAVTLRDGTDATIFKRYLNIVPDLVWSVQPKLGQDDRKRLVSTIPPVLGVLREGLTLIDYPKDAMQTFFGKLMNSHAQAVRALELAHGNPGVPFEPSTMRIKLDGIKLDDIASPPADVTAHVPDEQVRQLLAKARADVNHVAVPTTAMTLVDSRTDLSADAADAMIAGFKRSDWFNLRQGDVVERVQLRWVSPRKTLYLFVPAENRRGHSLSPEAMRAYLRNGDLAPVESAPLFDRAVNDLVNGLQRSADASPDA